MVEADAVIERQFRRRLPRVLNEEVEVSVERILVRFVADLLELRDGAGEDVRGSISHVHITRRVRAEVEKAKLIGSVLLVLLVLDELNTRLDDVRLVGPGPVARELPFRSDGAPGKRGKP